MPMTSSKALTSAGLIFAMALSAPLAFADQKDDLYKKGQTAINAGDSVAARDAFCALPKDYQDADAQCNTYKPLAERKLNLYKLNYSNGMQAMQSGDYAAAEIEFKKVKYGDYAEQAKQRLAEIPGLRQKAAEAANQAQQSAVAEQASKQKLDSGTNAFNNGDYNNAKSLLTQVSGSHQADAKTILDKIRTYESAVSQGNTFMANKDYASAKSAYQQAMSINPIGPSNATDLYTKAVTAGATASSTPSNPVPTGGGVKPPQPKPQIDVGSYLDQSRKAFAKKQFAKARDLVRSVVRQEPGNQEANDLLTQINLNDTTVSKAGTDDSELAGLISSFYQDISVNNFSDTEAQLKFYLLSKGKTGKTGLANFYLGASIMTRYYLSGGNDQNLHREAVNKFKAAKAVDGFKAPEKFISPKIMKAFEEAS